MMTGRLLISLLLVIIGFSQQILAQPEAFEETTWEATQLTLLIPSTWDDPITREDAGSVTLLLAQAFADQPDTRPPAIPLITLMNQPGTGADDIYGLMQNALLEIGIQPTGPRPTSLLQFDDALGTSGTSADGLLFGVGRAAVRSNGDVLIIIGRSASESRDSFNTLFETVADSLVEGNTAEVRVAEYGVIWHTERTLIDDETAFLDIIALGGYGDRLVVLDAFVGLVQLSAQTGLELEILPLPEEVLGPAGMAISDGVFFIADTGCACVHRWDGAWRIIMRDFGPGAPQSLLATENGLYATDLDETGVFVRRLTPGEEERLGFTEVLADQPLLAEVAPGAVIALADETIVYRLSGGLFEPDYELALSGTQVYAITANLAEGLLVATDTQGIVEFDTTGAIVNRIGRIVANFPQAGEVVNPRGLYYSQDGTLYWADSDGTFGNVTAVSQRVSSGRVGSSQLVPGLAVQGSLTAFTNQQAWTYTSDGEERIALTVIGEFNSDLELALRLIDPNGGEVAYALGDPENSLPRPTDTQLLDTLLTLDGQYLILVERISGEGTYTLSLTSTLTIDLGEGQNEVRGELSAAVPSQRWAFTGQAGQVITLTQLAESGTLDPLLRLFDDQGELLDENDDAFDVALGRDSQIAGFSLPRDGQYIIETTRFDGEGRYRLIIVITNR